MKAKVFIRLKSGVLDPQGKAVEEALKTLGYDEVKGVRVGKFIELEVDGDSKEAVEIRVNEMSEKLLANTVVEDFKVEVE
ncbi:MAG: phosphoribosylformylglycinamidine synthase subunit PurS [Deltaproteobacteria bacterium]|nr:phosphoribosylformylglycinamidine synthase subunit PurS [Deltaproteobacteria bacterium]